MEKLIVLGTGNAQAIHCYNTCFAMKDGEEYFLTDAGGGNGILLMLEKKGIPLEKIHHIFVTHAHNDHVLGMVWIIRMIATSMNKGTYRGNLTIYCHEELTDIIKQLCYLTVGKKFTRHFDERILFQVVHDKEKVEILGDTFTFFDVQSTKEKQFAYQVCMKNDIKLTFLGDEPYREGEEDYVKDADWLLHEAFCVYDERELYKPYEKHHSTVKDAAILAEKMGSKHMILWHTEDRDMLHRKEKYLLEGKAFYHGELFVPEDGEEFIF